MKLILSAKKLVKRLEKKDAKILIELIEVVEKQNKQLECLNDDGK